ncbi:MAG: hypothetical protein HQL69_20010 [Magnetococcales bacterium]|nr:hypothetical protein [Magnetococcales bacterium]
MLNVQKYEDSGLTIPEYNEEARRALEEFVIEIQSFTYEGKITAHSAIYNKLLCPKLKFDIQIYFLTIVNGYIINGHLHMSKFEIVAGDPEYIETVDEFIRELRFTGVDVESGRWQKIIKLYVARVQEVCRQKVKIADLEKKQSTFTNVDIAKEASKLSGIQWAQKIEKREQLVEPIIREMKMRGCTDQQVADELNRHESIPTPRRGYPWNRVAVLRASKKLGLK